MNCEQCRERLQDFLDETLEAAERAQVSEHAAACETCRRELEELRKAAALVSSLNELPEPAGFLQAVRERIDKPTVWERVRGLLSQPLRPGVSVAIPVIIVAFIAVFVVMNLPPRTTHRPKKADEDGREEGVEMAYAYEKKAPSPGAEETASFGQQKSGPSEEPAEPDATAASRLRRAAGDENAGTQEALSGAGTGTLEEATDADEVAKAEGAKPKLEETTKLATRGKAEGAERDAARTAEHVNGDTITTAKAVGGGPGAHGEDRADGTETALDRRDRTGAGGAGGKDKGAEDEGEEDEGEDAQQTANDVLLVGVGGPRGDQKARPLGDVETIQLIVFDLPTDLTNVKQIVVDEGGQISEQRAKTALTGLVVQVPTSNFARTVQKLSVYNETNRLAVEQEKDQNQDQAVRNSRAAQLAKGQQRRGWLKPLPLIVQRIVSKTPAADE